MERGTGKGLFLLALLEGKEARKGEKRGGKGQRKDPSSSENAALSPRKRKIPVPERKKGQRGTFG